MVPHRIPYAATSFSLRPGYEDSLSVPGDRRWHAAHAELRKLHVNKSSTYGTDEDPLANFTAVAAKNGQPPEFYALERIEEKLTRAMNMIRAGKAGAVKEYPDIASLALCAEALLRRRSP